MTEHPAVAQRPNRPAFEKTPAAACGGRGATMRPFPRTSRCECLGVSIDLLEVDAIIETYRQAIEAKRRLLVDSVNLHAAYYCKTNAEVRSFFWESDLLYVDGMPIVWWLMCLGYPAHPRHRATFADWLPALLRRARDEGWRVYYLGNRPGVTAKVAEDFRQQLPGLEMRTAHGYFDRRRNSEENKAVVADINEFCPHILLVGMGIPKQERWVLENAGELNAIVVQCCGGTADLFANVIPFAPRILGRLGLEGVFRLLTRPHRLWRRYLVEPWFLLDLAAKDLWRAYGPIRSCSLEQGERSTWRPSKADDT